MRTRQLLVALLLLVAPACKGNSHDADAGGGRARPAGVVSLAVPTGQAKALFMWELVGDRPSYLFGTFHFGVNADETFPPIVWERLLAADTLVFEADINNMDAAKSAPLTDYPLGESLKQKLTPQQWQTLVAVVGESVALPDLERSRPFVAITLCLLAMAAPTQLMDLYMEDRGRDAGKRIEFLEDPIWQLGVVAEVTTLEDLKAFLGDVPGQQKRLRDSMSAYVQGDTATFKALVLDEKYMTLRKQQRLLHLRNGNWLPKIEAHIAAGNAFIAVGSAHFVGDNSIIELLEAKGHKLKRVVP